MRIDSREYLHVPVSGDLTGATVTVGYAASPAGVPASWFATEPDAGGVKFLVDPNGATSLVPWKNQEVWLIVKIDSNPEDPIIVAGSVYAR